ncbi:MAG: IclR family transcriptional regulator [Acidobacteria bacterium]|nr:IclR family transcriptional regulator [Acidobacteriota bacterium]
MGPRRTARENGETRPEKSRYSVPNLERALEILECLVEFPEGLPQSELAARMGCAKTSVFRITATLLEWGYLERKEDQRSLALSRKLLAMGTRALHEKDLVGTAIDVMRDLRDRLKETVLIGTIAGGEFIVLEQVLGSYPFKFSVDAGARLPLHTAAPAKALIAWLPEAEREALIARSNFHRFTATTITDAVRYGRELSEVRKCGYATDRGEQLSGIHCVAAPVFGRYGYPVGAVWTTGPADRIPESDLQRVGELMAVRVMVISGRLGHGLLTAVS